MNDLADIASGVLILAGAAFALLACVGLWRFDDLYSRIHSATKATTLGMLLTALGAAFQMGGHGDRAKLLLACILQLVPGCSTLPVRYEARATTLGMLLTALGAAFQMGGHGDRAKLLLACILQLVTAPVSAHMVARASYRTGSVEQPGTSVDHLAEDLAAED